MASVAQFGIAAVEQGIPSIIGFIKADLGLSATTAGLVVAAYPGGKFFGAYAAGRAADLHGERAVLLIGGFATAVFVAIAAALPFVPMMMLCAFAGAAGSAGTPAGGRLVMKPFVANRRGLALSIRQTAVPAAGVLAAATLPWIAQFEGWR